MSITAETLQVWIAVIEESYLESSTCVAWADREIQSAAPVPPWLLDLCYASDRETTLSHLCAGLRDLCAWPQQAWPHDHTSLRLGMMWLRHERGDLTLPELLSGAGAVADVANYGSPGCEAFYFLLNEIDGRGPPWPGSAPVAESAAELFAVHTALARESLVKLVPCSPPEQVHGQIQDGPAQQKNED